MKRSPRALKRTANAGGSTSWSRFRHCNWWLRDPVSRASFLLAAAYLVRDRDVKLRIYPGIAPMLVIPFIFLLQGYGHKGSGGMTFGISFSGAYLGLVPFLGLQILQYSQQWQAADVFRVAPMPGPARCATVRAVPFFVFWLCRWWY